MAVGANQDVVDMLLFLSCCLKGTFCPRYHDREEQLGQDLLSSSCADGSGLVREVSPTCTCRRQRSAAGKGWTSGLAGKMNMLPLLCPGPVLFPRVSGTQIYWCPKPSCPACPHRSSSSPEAPCPCCSDEQPQGCSHHPQLIAVGCTVFPGCTSLPVTWKIKSIFFPSRYLPTCPRNMSAA